MIFSNSYMKMITQRLNIYFSVAHQQNTKRDNDFMSTNYFSTNYDPGVSVKTIF